MMQSKGMELGFKLRNSMRSKNKDEVVTILQDIAGLSSGPACRALEYYILPCLAEIVTGDFTKREISPALTAIRNLTCGKQSRFSREMEALCDQLVLYVLTQDPDFGRLSAAILLNLIQNEAIFKGLELRVSDFSGMHEVLLQRVYAQDCIPEYIDLLISFYVQSGTTIASDLLYTKLESFQKDVKALSSDEEKVELFDGLCRMFEICEPLKKIAKAEESFRTFVNEHTSGNPKFLKIWYKFLTVDFLVPDEVVTLMGSIEESSKEHRFVVFQILDYFVQKKPKECENLISKELFAEAVSCLNADLKRENCAIVASFLIDVAQRDVYQAAIKKRLKFEKIGPLIQQMLSKFSSSESGFETEHCEIILKLLYLVAAMSKICGTFYNEFTKLTSDYRVLAVLSFALCEGTPEEKLLVLKISSSMGFDREKFCQILHQNQVTAEEGGRTIDKQTSVCSSMYDPRLRDVKTILECCKERLSMESSGSELMEIFELEIAGCEEKIALLEENADQTYRLLHRERKIRAKQYNHIAELTELLSVKDMELKAAKEGLEKAVQELTASESEKNELEHKARKEVGTLRNDIEKLYESLNRSSTELMKAREDLNQFQLMLKESQDNAAELKESCVELETQLEKEKTSHHNLKMKNAGLIAELESEQGRARHLEAEVAKLHDESKTKEDELFELRRFKQMICELSTASGKKL